jgi:hypothetical protein
MSADIVPPLAANMNAAFKNVRGSISGPADPALRDLIVDRIVELAKDGVCDIDADHVARSFQSETPLFSGH